MTCGSSRTQLPTTFSLARSGLPFYKAGRSAGVVTYCREAVASYQAYRPQSPAFYTRYATTCGLGLLIRNVWAFGYLFLTRQIEFRTFFILFPPSKVRQQFAAASCGSKAAEDGQNGGPPRAEASARAAPEGAAEPTHSNFFDDSASLSDAGPSPPANSGGQGMIPTSQPAAAPRNDKRGGRRTTKEDSHAALGITRKESAATPRKDKGGERRTPIFDSYTQFLIPESARRLSNLCEKPYLCTNGDST